MTAAEAARAELREMISSIGHLIGQANGPLRVVLTRGVVDNVTEASESGRLIALRVRLEGGGEGKVLAHPAHLVMVEPMVPVPITNTATRPAWGALR